MISAEKTIQYARETLGTPFAHQGRVNGVAMDCAGPVCHVMERYGFDFTDLKAYPTNPYNGMMESILGAQPHLKMRPHTNFCPGDILLFRFKAAPQHLAVCVGENRILHAYGYGKDKKVVEHSLSQKWLRRLARVYEIEQ